LSPERYIVVGAFVVDKAGAAPTTSYGLSSRSCRGRRAGHMHTRILQELGRPCRSPGVTFRLVGTGLPTPGPRSGVWADGSEATDTAPGSAKRRQRSAAPGTQGVAQRHSTVEAGELAPEDPAEGRALPADGPSRGNQAEYSVTPAPVTVTLLDSGWGVRWASVRGLTAALPTRPLTNRMP
jgi:hypothetical protein